MKTDDATKDFIELLNNVPIRALAMFTIEEDDGTEHPAEYIINSGKIVGIV